MFSLELRVSPLRFAAPIAMLIAFVVAAVASYPAVASWTSITDAAMSGVEFAAPAVAGLGAWTATRRRRTRLEATEDTAALDRFQIQTPQLGASIVWVVAATALYLIALAIRGAMIGMTGSPDLPAILSVFVQVILFLTVGFTIGCLIQRWVAVPVAVAAPLGLYAVAAFGIGRSSALAWNPFHGHTTLPGFAFDPVFYIGQVLVMVGYVTLLWLLLVALWSTRRWLTVPLLAAILPLSIIGGSLLSATGGQNLIPDQIPLITAHDSNSGTTIGVQPIYEPVSQKLLVTWSRLNRLTSGTSIGFDDPLLQDVDAVVAETPPGHFYRLILNPSVTAIAADSVETVMFDVRSCQFEGKAPDSSWWLEGDLVTMTWLSGRTEFGANIAVGDPEMYEALKFLWALSDEKAHQWVQQHVKNITDCSWERSDFR